MAREIDLGNVIGPQGEAGKSAYEVWKAQPGNEGKTEVEYLTELKGEKGDQGEVGPTGETGKSAYEVWKAQPGNEGKTEEEFLEALKGAAGEAGPAGTDGKTPSFAIKDDGHLYAIFDE